MVYFKSLPLALGVLVMVSVSSASPIIYEKQTINVSYVDFPASVHHWVEFMGFNPARGTLLEVVVTAYWESVFYYMFENPTAEPQTITQETDLNYRAFFGSTAIFNDPGSFPVRCTAVVPAHSTAICTLGAGNERYVFGYPVYSYYHPSGGWGDPVVEEYLAAGPLSMLVYTETFTYVPPRFPMLSSHNFTLTVEYGFIPEPSTFGLALFGATFLVVLSVRRRGNA